MSDRYEDQFQSDSIQLVDGDSAFIGLDNRRAPENLPQGYVAISQNMRLNQMSAIVRQGMQKQTNAISFNGSPLIVPFTVGSGAVIVDNATNGIYGSVLWSDPNNNNTEWIMVATGSKAFMFTPGQSVVTINYPANETITNTDTVDMFQAGGNVYILRGRTDVAMGVSSIVHTTTTATVTTTVAHLYSSNQWVRVAGANQSAYNGDFQITVTGATTFTYVMASDPGSNATGTLVLNRLKIPLKWAGNQSSPFTLLGHGSSGGLKIIMPTSNFGMLQANRAFLDYTRGQIIISDINNVESYDSVFGVISFAQGWSDYQIGLHPYQDNQTLVFLRRSIYLLNYVNGDVASITNQLLTAQVGCISKSSIQTCGSDVLFLSDLGVFRLQPGFELTLRGNWEPLSAPIQSTIDTINSQAIQQSVSAYWKNRYFLAVPTGSNTRNNVLLVYNFINNAWESIDTFPNGFYCDRMVVMNLNNTGTLFLISREGGIYAYEQLEYDEFGAAGSAPAQYVIDGQLKTRRLTYGTTNIKRFERVVSNVVLNANSSLQTSAVTLNPDATKVLQTYTTVASLDATNPSLISKRGYGVQVFFENLAGRSTIRNYKVTAHEMGRKNVKIS